MKQKSQFRQWFEEQFGKCPSSLPYHKLKEDWNRKQDAAEAARRLLVEVERYQEWEKAAHYAWLAHQTLNEKGNLK